jgi:hypothetical protein
VVALTIAVAVLAVVVFVLLAAVRELVKDVLQLRAALGILDRPLDVDVGSVAGTLPSSYGLPDALDAEAAAVVLFLSERCGTCRSIAASFVDELPDGLWVVLEASSPDAAAEFLEDSRLPAIGGGRVVIDVAGGVAERIGLNTTPVAFRVAAGRITSATTVPSARYLTSIVPQPIRLRRAQQSDPARRE